MDIYSPISRQLRIDLLKSARHTLKFWIPNVDARKGKTMKAPSSRVPHRHPYVENLRATLSASRPRELPHSRPFHGIKVPEQIQHSVLDLHLFLCVTGEMKRLSGQWPLVACGIWHCGHKVQNVVDHPSVILASAAYAADPFLILAARSTFNRFATVK